MFCYFWVFVVGLDVFSFDYDVLFVLVQVGFIGLFNVGNWWYWIFGFVLNGEVVFDYFLMLDLVSGSFDLFFFVSLFDGFWLFVQEENIFEGLFFVVNCYNKIVSIFLGSIIVFIIVFSMEWVGDIFSVSIIGDMFDFYVLCIIDYQGVGLWFNWIIYGIVWDFEWFVFLQWLEVFVVNCFVLLGNGW